jgi:thiol:disulfide interchange protein DsbG
MKPIFSSSALRPTPFHFAGALVAWALLALPLSGCSKANDTANTAQPAVAAAVSAPATPLNTYDRIAQQTKGFSVGALMVANPVYVLFDPQCPHCGHLWQASLPLHKKVKFVWVPVGVMNAKSLPQGAIILGASNPAERMTAHEASLLAGTGGTPVSGDIDPEMLKTLKANTQAYNALQVESVPMIVAKHAKTGALITRMGALDTPTLAAFLGVDAPQ